MNSDYMFCKVKFDVKNNYFSIKINRDDFSYDYRKNFKCENEADEKANEIDKYLLGKDFADFERSEKGKDNDIFLKPKEIEGILNFKKSKINQLLKEGTLPAYQIGRSYRISSKYLEEYMYLDTI